MLGSGLRQGRLTAPNYALVTFFALHTTGTGSPTARLYAVGTAALQHSRADVLRR